MNEPRLVAVLWEDTTNIAGWMDMSDIHEFAQDGSWHCTNVGWLVYEDEHCVVVAARRASSGSWGLNERIPKSTITKILDLHLTSS